MPFFRSFSTISGMRSFLPADWAHLRLAGISNLSTKSMIAGTAAMRKSYLQARSTPT